MKCPICHQRLEIVDQWDEEQKETIVRHLSGYCEDCSADFDWEEIFKFEKIQDLRQVNPYDQVIKKF